MPTTDTAGKCQPLETVMPKIDAPTVAEHHSRRRAALLAAAEALIAAHGVPALTLSAVGAAAGLARSSVYQYFDSTPALVAAVVEDAFSRTNQQLQAAVDPAATPDARIDAYVRFVLQMATEPTNRAIHQLGHADLPTSCRARLAELHREQYAPLRRAIAELHTPDSTLTTALVLGIIGAAVQAVTQGSPLPRVQRRTLQLIHTGLDNPK